ncbi:hypothetical protein EDS67_26290 [candidate division KSB1 bacterium]|nr:MAG: hypothetical protein EDS67_26290 [candidate division KSB1 bacterium]MBC6947069.1 hypothetical protein [candidate division KSB1 bacterium]MCE7944706.1 hypothetical protein [Chlorobi bacterium CHB1]
MGSFSTSNTQAIHLTINLPFERFLLNLHLPQTFFARRVLQESFGAGISVVYIYAASVENSKGKAKPRPLS